MARLIDAEPILKRWNTESLGRKEMYDMVRNAPIVDALLVVRCKDCIWQEECDITEFMGGGNGYCRSGERRNDETD